MANKCIYEMKVKGNKDKIEKLLSYLKADYRYDDIKLLECTADKHFFGIFKCEVIKKEKNNGFYEYILSGICAWSVKYCMFKDDYSFHSSYMKLNKNNFKGTTLVEESRILNLDIEIFSEEMVSEFMEHFLIKKGEILINDCINYTEEYDELLDEYKYVGGVEWNYQI